MLTAVGTCLFCWMTEVYRLLPKWGAVRKFDSDGSEAHRAREALIAKEYTHHQAAQQQQHGSAGTVGTIGAPTWGRIESADLREVSMQHPVYGTVKTRPGFNQTQKLRKESEWWGKDELHFMKEKRMHIPEMHINEPRLAMQNEIV
eukprot:CAMPEP_0197649578 /NCGR_PEP_ID=MMETSP1338-20131121/28904_1 /TAXON_ID=43686 ORGANISM="Pelagodinium beii, Strain RCC1491" /NCGR_SAMPLE_ID=MMETSP1338 /ASSEMBLY_ACC=CAM_ASM_000754 /LENGTH=145 /DNA_ID=CAMNT_0043223805 /DNA_START=239 /DNA_END=676 /DNA_ORIENTATION=-